MSKAATCPEACMKVLRDGYAARGIEATISTAPPLIRTPYEQGAFICPHGVRLYHAPTSEQIAAWARDGER